MALAVSHGEFVLDIAIHFLVHTTQKEGSKDVTIVHNLRPGRGDIDRCTIVGIKVCWCWGQLEKRFLRDLSNLRHPAVMGLVICVIRMKADGVTVSGSHPKFPQRV